MKILTPEFLYYFVYVALGLVYPIFAFLWVLVLSNRKKHATPQRLERKYVGDLSQIPFNKALLLAIVLCLLMLSIHTSLLIWNIHEIRKGLWIGLVGLVFNYLNIGDVLRFPITKFLEHHKKPRSH